MEGPIRTYRDMLKNDQALFINLRRSLMEQGIFQLPLNLKRNHVSFTHTDVQIEKTLEITEAILKDVSRKPIRKLYREVGFPAAPAVTAHLSTG